MSIKMADGKDKKQKLICQNPPEYTADAVFGDTQYDE